MRPIKICLLGTPSDYMEGIVPLLIRQLGFHISLSSASQADLIIYGPFYQKLKKYRYLPKPFRPLAMQLHEQLNQRLYRPITLFHTSENIRHDFIDTDYSISFDMTNESNQFRMPYWMEMVDWSHEGITGNTNPRFGKLLSIDQMMQPLGNKFLTRNRKAALITSHLREPRKTLLNVLSEIIEVDGFGPYFNSDIKNQKNILNNTSTVAIRI